MIRAGAVAVLILVMLLSLSSEALAYPGSDTGGAGSQLKDCVDCHSEDSAALLGADGDPEELAKRRKGPHGGYTTGTDKCQTCHTMHGAGEGATNLLPGTSIKDTCESCHDGTGGPGVYGVIKARTGVEPRSAHRIDETSTIPGGDSSGGALAGSFSGENGTLSCGDCHSPHDSDTVEPFSGDRLRSSVESDTGFAVKTNRLLRQVPTGAEATTTVYGTGWCASCHRGRLNQHESTSGVIADHAVMPDDDYYYDRLPVVTGPESSETTIGSLGGSNRGYVMPDDPNAASRQKSPLQLGRGPICQQCHEDARKVGPESRGTTPTLAADQEFKVTQPAGGSPADNPRFQVFPHESDVESFLVRAPTPTDPYQPCLACHALKHDVPAAYEECVLCHDGDAIDIHEASEPGCDACHAAEIPTFDCGACHPDRLEPHGAIPELHTVGTPCATSGCHDVSVAVIHEVPGCSACHSAGVTPSLVCSNCHSGNMHPLADHSSTVTCDSCHSTADLVSIHGDDCS
ncbi:MAG TPA: cytochrome c3 family protein, partial [Coriobacteriia bacterium]|nr:cytochrome c3 family protein [Coriobacteriia bacterium]